MFKFAKNILLAFAFTLVAIHFLFLAIILRTRDWNTPIFPVDGFMPSPIVFLLVALGAVTVGLVILFVIAYLVSKLLKYD